MTTIFQELIERIDSATTMVAFNLIFSEMAEMPLTPDERGLAEDHLLRRIQAQWANSESGKLKAVICPASMSPTMVTEMVRAKTSSAIAVVPLTGLMSCVCSYCDDEYAKKVCEPEMDGEVSHGICSYCAIFKRTEILSLLRDGEKVAQPDEVIRTSAASTLTATRTGGHSTQTPMSRRWRACSGSSGMRALTLIVPRQHRAIGSTRGGASVPTSRPKVKLTTLAALFAAVLVMMVVCKHF